jgi:heat shock protein HslJ
MLLPTTTSRLAIVLGSIVSCAVMAGELDGSDWRLVNIASMDDSIYLPDDSNRYTLSLDAKSRAVVRADCNRGTGSWTSASPGQLRFGPIATTRALCPAESLSEKYLAQFEWVRSYIIRDGHLFLSTMVDGSIIEFEPLPPAVATLFGEQVYATDATELQGVVVTRLLDRYAAQHSIDVESQELEAFLGKMEAGMAAEGLTADDNLTPKEARQVDAMRRRLGVSLIRQWKINKSLYETYGGRIIYQQLGPEPLDAYRQYLEARQTAGDFTIENSVMAEQFWGYFTDESRHVFMESGGEDAARAFTTPPWEGIAEQNGTR